MSSVEQQRTRQVRKESPSDEIGRVVAQDHLRALVRLVARQAAQEFVASSLTDRVGEDHDQTTYTPDRS